MEYLQREGSGCGTTSIPSTWLDLVKVSLAIKAETILVSSRGAWPLLHLQYPSPLHLRRPDSWTKTRLKGGEPRALKGCHLTDSVV